MDGSYTKTEVLSQVTKLYEARNSQITITFTNDKGKRDVFFHSETPTKITAPSLDQWKCGSTNEDSVRCPLLLGGMFAWGQTYTIIFYGKFILPC